MKKIVFSIVGSMIVSICALQAQVNDTTGTSSNRSKQQNKQRSEQSRQHDQNRQQRDQAWQSQSDRSQGQDAYANQGMVVVEKKEIPSSLKQTLNDDKYAGWENATIYHNTKTGEYVIAPRAYRFDKQGKEIEMGSAAGYGSRDGRTGRYSGGQQRDQSTSQSQNGQTEAQEQMSEIPTSASQDPSDNNRQSGQSSQSQQQAGSDDRTQQDQSAQQPSSGYRTDDDQSNSNGQSSSGTQTQAGQNSQNEYRTEDMVEIQTEQVPNSLRRTLKGSQYKGWEDSGKLYQDPSTNGYVLEMDNSAGASQSPQYYRFDKNGKMQDDKNESSRGGDDQ